MGIREDRHIQGEYVLTADDIYNYKQFDDVVVLYGYPIDVPDPEDTNLSLKRPGGNSRQILYRCLLSLKVENLLIAGCCVSATQWP